MKTLSFTVVVVSFLAVLPACDLFGAVSCKDEGDCPDNLPFCTAGTCSKTDDGGRDGRGVDGGCAADSDCENGLCDIDGVYGAAGSCLPPADDATADCSGDPAVLGQPRSDEAAPVIFAVQANAIGDGCYSGVSFKWFQREPQPITNAFFELIVGGGNLTQSVAPEGDATTMTLSGTLCGATLGQKAGLVMNLGGNSNVACLPVAQ